jgi:molybdopterin/thiamine biosynthesis adenylyltransferase
MSSWYDKNIYLIGENEAALLKWIRNRNREKVLSKIQVVPIPLLWLPRPLRPEEFPGNVGALLSVLRKLKVDQVFISQMIQDEGLQQKNVLLGFDGKCGVGFAGLHINKPPKSINNGFRGKPPEDVLLTRYKGVSISGAVVSRLDGPWVHGRDHNSQESVLAKKSVVIFGIGSVGSVVVELLAKSGVGKLTLVDPETVASENICRHALGVPSIGKSKALELAQVLASRYPHLEFEGAHKSCEAFVREMPEKLQTADLVISTIGNWRAEIRLNEFAREFEAFPPIIYGWTEAHAVAGHAVAFFRGHGCLRCLTDDVGKVKVPVTTWPAHGTLLPVPACGGHFQPYGAVELSYIHGLIADIALDILIGKVTGSIYRVWIGQRKLLDYAGEGRWNAKWIELYGDPGLGGQLVEVDLIHNPSCPECGGEE